MLALPTTAIRGRFAIAVANVSVTLRKAESIQHRQIVSTAGVREVRRRGDLLG